MQFFVVFEKFARAYLFQIALEIIWLPIQIGQDTFFKLEHSQQDPETPLGHFLVEIRLNQTSSYNIKT